MWSGGPLRLGKGANEGIEEKAQEKDVEEDGQEGGSEGGALDESSVAGKRGKVGTGGRGRVVSAEGAVVA